jgi:hypothetical protein
VEGGALKRTDDGRWAHITCALWLPKARLGNVTSMQPVEGVKDAIKKQRERGTVCAVCDIDHGACVKCSHAQCELCFHPLCAWYSGLNMNIESVDIDCRFFVFCPMHTPEHALVDTVTRGKQLLLRQQVAKRNSAQQNEDEASTEGKGESLFDLFQSPQLTALTQLWQSGGGTNTSMAFEEHMPAAPTVHMSEAARKGWVPPLVLEQVPASTQDWHLPVLPGLKATMDGRQIVGLITAVASAAATRKAKAAAPANAQVRDVEVDADTVCDKRVLLRIAQQRELRNRGRLDQSRLAKGKRRTMKLMEGSRQRDFRGKLAHEDRYEPNRCAVCFLTNAEVLFQFHLDQRSREEAMEKAQAEANKKNSSSTSSSSSSSSLVVSGSGGNSAAANTPIITGEDVAIWRRKTTMLRCETCEMDIHQHCYGVRDQEIGGRWNCVRCSAKHLQSVACVLCPRKGGAMKQTVDGRWCHVACAMWLPEVSFLDPLHLDHIVGCQDVAWHRKKLRCTFCKRAGPCIQCDHNGCTAAFHVTCGLMSGSFMHLNEHKGITTMSCRCRKHTPLHVLRGVDIPKEYSRALILWEQMQAAADLVRLTRDREVKKLKIAELEWKMLDEEMMEIVADTPAPQKNKEASEDEAPSSATEADEQDPASVSRKRKVAPKASPKKASPRKSKRARR